MSDVTFQPIETIVHGVEDARLVFIDGKLGAVVVKLGDVFGDLAQRWHAEAAFNSVERMTDTTFSDLKAIEDWIVRNHSE